MVLFIDPPVHVCSTADEIGAWQRELAAMRDRYRADPQALACIAREQRHAEQLLALVERMGPPAALRAS